MRFSDPCWGSEGWHEHWEVVPRVQFNVHRDNGGKILGYSLASRRPTYGRETMPKTLVSTNPRRAELADW